MFAWASIYCVWKFTLNSLIDKCIIFRFFADIFQLILANFKYSVIQVIAMVQYNQSNGTGT